MPKDVFMKTSSPLSLGLSLALSVAPVVQAGSTSPAAASYTVPLRHQLQAQGRMVLGELREARDAGLRGDPWGMGYSLQQARRLLEAMALADSLRAPHHPPHAGAPPTRPVLRGLKAPLDQREDVDTPLAGARWQRLAETERSTGSIPLQAVAEAIERALGALNGHAPDIGAALLATSEALGQVQWNPALVPAAWVEARDQAIRADALLLQHRPSAAATSLRQAREILSGLPGGKAYADRISALLQATAPDRRRLVTLAQELGGKVQALRDAQERAALGG